MGDQVSVHALLKEKNDKIQLFEFMINDQRQTIKAFAHLVALLSENGYEVTEEIKSKIDVAHLFLNGEI